MKVLTFIFGMFVATAGVGLWSALTGAPAGTVALRMVATLVLAQVFYVAVILLMTRANRRADRARATEGPAGKAAAFPAKAAAPSRSPH